MSQTGGLSTFFPLIALTSSGSSAVPAEAASATASETPRSKTSNQFPTPEPPDRPAEEKESYLRRRCSGRRRAAVAWARRGRTCRRGGGRWTAARAAGTRSPFGTPGFDLRRARGCGEGEAETPRWVAGELATTWLGRQARLAQPLRRGGGGVGGGSEGDWDHWIRLDERIRDEMNGVDNTWAIVMRDLWAVGCGEFPNLVRLPLHSNASKAQDF
jgi:hypothetical protein